MEVARWRDCEDGRDPAEETMKYVRLGTMALYGIVSAGCVSTPVPHDKVASSEAAVRSAAEVGAGEVPQADVYLELAQRELDQGKALMRDGNNRDAAAQFDRAQADAEVALALSKEQKTRAAAQQAKQRAQALRSGIPGSGIGGGPVPNQQPPAPPATPPPAPPVQPEMQAPPAPAPQQGPTPQGPPR